MKTLAIVVLAACGSAPRPQDISHHEPAKVAVGDADGDGIPDDQDRCPTLAEDFDLHEDDDGCPDLDDDHDGVPDEKDPCFDLPGTEGNGCPEGCTLMHTISDCFFITPIWTEGATSAADLAVTKKDFDDYPEIRTVTLTAALDATDPPGTMEQRLTAARRALVAAGIPADKLAFDPKPMMRDHPGRDVFGMITKQRFSDGPFRSTSCTHGMGSVYRVAREINYSCHPVVCGDGICYHATEDDGSCPKDCPP